MAETIADNPALAALWDVDKNEHAATDVLAKTYRTAWWKCVSGHSFQRKPRMMTKDPSCPQCALGGASLADTHPHLAKRWHPAKNGMKSSAITASHTASVWWACEEGHAFERPHSKWWRATAAPTAPCAAIRWRLATRKSPPSGILIATAICLRSWSTQITR